MKSTSPKKPMDDWVDKAFTDDDMVAELLLRIKHTGTEESKNPALNLPPLRWGFRKPRSRLSRLGINTGIGVGIGGSSKKETDSARASPMTPLCWSGGSNYGGSTSPSDGFEEDTSHQQPSCSTDTGSGSKAINEFTSSCSRRSKKKKTFLELKDAEILHLKERFELEKKIANVEATYKERNVKNQSLKRIKLEYSDRAKTDHKESRKRRQLLFKNKEQESETKTFFFVPDLNMTPTEED